VLVWITVKSLRVDAGWTAVTSFGAILDLALDIALTHGDCTEFVAADAAIQYFFIATLDVEIPDFAVANDRKRERPIALPHLQELESLCFNRKRMLYLIRFDEARKKFLSVARVAGDNKLLRSRTEQWF